MSSTDRLDVTYHDFGARLHGRTSVLPTLLSPRADRDRFMNEFFGTNLYVDPETGEEYDPDVLPDDPAQGDVQSPRR